MTDTSNEQIKGSLLVLAGAAFWGACFFVAKVAGEQVEPILFTWYVSLFGAAGVLVLRRKNPLSLYSLFVVSPLAFAGLSLSGMVFGNVLLYVSLQRLSLALCSVLERSQPLFVVLLGAVFLGERLTRRTAFYGAMALLAGTILALSDTGNGASLRGDFIGVAAIIGTGFFWAVSTILGKHLTSKHPSVLDIVALRFLLGVLFLTPILLLFFPPLELLPNAEVVLSAAAIAFLGVIGFLLYYAGLKSVSATRSCFLELTQPLTGVVLGLAALQEDLSLLQLVAIPALLYAAARLAQTE